MYVPWSFLSNCLFVVNVNHFSKKKNLCSICTHKNITVICVWDESHDELFFPVKILQFTDNRISSGKLRITELRLFNPPTLSYLSYLCCSECGHGNDKEKWHDGRHQRWLNTVRLIFVCLARLYKHGFFFFVSACMSCYQNTCTWRKNDLSILY